MMRDFHFNSNENAAQQQASTPATLTPTTTAAAGASSRGQSLEDILYHYALQLTKDFADQALANLGNRDHLSQSASRPAGTTFAAERNPVVPATQATQAQGLLTALPMLHEIIRLNAMVKEQLAEGERLKQLASEREAQEPTGSVSLAGATAAMRVYEMLSKKCAANLQSAILAQAKCPAERQGHIQAEVTQSRPHEGSATWSAHPREVLRPQPMQMMPNRAFGTSDLFPPNRFEVAQVMAQQSQMQQQQHTIEHSRMPFVSVQARAYQPAPQPLSMAQGACQQARTEASTPLGLRLARAMATNNGVGGHVGLSRHQFGQARSEAGSAMTDPQQDGRQTHTEADVDRQDNEGSRRRRRRRLTIEQKNLLEQEWQIDSNWSTQRIGSIARRLGMNRTKVYKWSWDRRNLALREVQEQAARANAPVVAIQPAEEVRADSQEAQSEAAQAESDGN